MKGKFNLRLVGVLQFIVILLLCSNTTVAQDVLLDKLYNMYQRYSDQKDEKVYLQTDRDRYVVGDTILVRAFLFPAPSYENRYGESRFVYVDLINQAGEVKNREKILYDSISNSFVGYVRMYDNVVGGEYELQAYTYWMQNKGVESFFRKKIYISEYDEENPAQLVCLPKAAELNVAFFPEGTNLIPGKLQKVAFMCTGNFEGINGVIKDNDGLKVADIVPDQYGYGVFSIAVEAEKSYTAYLTDSRGVVKTFPVANVEVSSAYAISIEKMSGNSIAYNISYTPDVNLDGKYMFVYNNLAFLSLSNAQNAGIMQIDSTITDGIIYFALIDEDGRVYSSRAWYHVNDKLPTFELELSTDAVMGKSGQVTLALNDSDNAIDMVDVTVSVVPLDNVYDTSLNNGISSYINLSSEFDYELQNPDFYLSNDAKLNDLLIIQGSKFHHLGELEEMLAKFKSSVFNKEYDMILEGFIVNKKGKPLTCSVVKRRGKLVQSGKLWLEGDDRMNYYAYPNKSGYFKRGGIHWDNEVRFFSELDYYLGTRTVYLLLFLQDYLNDFDYAYIEKQNTKSKVGKKSEEWTDNKARYKVTKSLQGFNSNFLLPGTFLQGFGELGIATSTSLPSFLSSMDKPSTDRFMSVSSNNYPVKSYIYAKIKPSMRRLTHFAPQRRRFVAYDAEKTYLWRVMVHVDKDNPYTFTLPESVVGKDYAIMVNGVDSNGNPVSALYKVQK